MTGTDSADATPSRLRYAFLGPAGTFTEAALRKVCLLYTSDAADE